MTSVMATAKLDSEGRGAFGERGPGTGRKKDQGKISGVEVDFAWGDGTGEEFKVISDLGGRSGNLEKLLRKKVKGLWRGIAGVPHDGLPDNLDKQVVDAGEETHIQATKKKRPVFTLCLDSDSKRPLRLEHHQGKRTTATHFGFTKVGEENVLTSLRISNEVGMEVKSETTLSWDKFREVSGRPLPTVGKVDFGESSITFRFTYTTVNGAPAKVKEATKAEVKDLAKTLSKAFKGSLGDKEAAIGAALDAGTDHAAKLLCPYIYDKEAGVAVVKALAKMGKKTATSSLVSAFGRTKRRVELHETVIWALGELNDQKAVPSLAKNIWGGAGSEGWGHQARLRIKALGKIRHHSAVDQLVDMVDDGRRRWGGHIRGDVMASLRKLTGQSFRSSREWKDWWKKNRSSFRF
ncbi:MAG: HEAT repeat domain-containing protein [Planctomycetota bacterium]